MNLKVIINGDLVTRKPYWLPGRWRIIDDYASTVIERKSDGKLLYHRELMPGQVTDLGSVFSFGRIFVDPAGAGSHAFGNHDMDYRFQEVSRKTADWAMYHVMMHCGETERIAKLTYTSVRAGGWRHYKKDTVKEYRIIQELVDEHKGANI